jgi:hypothetical protein
MSRKKHTPSINFLLPLPQYLRIYDTKRIGRATCDTKIVQVFSAFTRVVYLCRVTTKEFPIPSKLPRF